MDGFVLGEEFAFEVGLFFWSANVGRYRRKARIFGHDGEHLPEIRPVVRGGMQEPAGGEQPVDQVDDRCAENPVAGVAVFRPGIGKEDEDGRNGGGRHAIFKGLARFADQMMRRKSIFCCPSDLRNTYRRSYTLNQKLTIVTTAEGDYSGQPKYKLHQLRNPSSLILASEFQQYRSGSAIYHNRLFEPQYAATGDFSWPFPDQRCFHGGFRNNSVFLDLHAATVNPLVYRDLRYWQP